MRAIMRTIDSPPPPEFLLSTTDFLGAYENMTDIPKIPFLTKEEEDFLVEQFSVQGFNYCEFPIPLNLHNYCVLFVISALQFYTNPNRLSYYNHVNAQGNFTIPQSALYISPTGVCHLLLS